MKQLFILLLGVMLFASCNWLGKGSPRKSFVQTYSAGVFNEANCIIAAKDGAFLLAGYSIEKDDPNAQDMPSSLYMVKIDADGHIVWDKKWAFSDFDEGTATIATTDGNYLMCGQTRSGDGNMNILLVKLNEKGDTIWTHSIGAEEGDASGNALVSTADGGYLIVGAAGVFSVDGSDPAKDIFIIKTDAKGIPVWNKTYGKQAQEYASDVKVTDGGYIVAGTTASLGDGMEDMFLMKIKDNGDTLWNHTYGGKESDYGMSVLPVAGGYLLAGTTKDTTGNQDIMLIMADKDGQMKWKKTYGGKDPEDFGGITTVPGGGYVIAGSAYDVNTTGNRYYLVRLNEKGDTLWTHSYPAEKNETAHGIAVTADKGFIIAGVKDAESRSSMYVLKVDENGVLVK